MFKKDVQSTLGLVDYNAALNLRDYFYKVIYNTVGTTEIKACGETSSTLRETLMQVVSIAAVQCEALGQLYNLP